MPLYYITGTPGSGKTTVQAELKRRGYPAYDTDDFAGYYDVATGQKVTGGRTAQERTAEWRKRHEWKVPAEKIAALRAEAGEKAVFLCGVTANDADEFWHEFTQVFCLYVPPAEVERRLLGRPDQNDFGKNPHELASALEWAAYAREQYEALGATIIDATQPVEAAVDEIISRVGNSTATARAAGGES